MKQLILRTAPFPKMRAALIVMLQFYCSFVTAQTFRVQGKIVTGTNKEAVAFANIYLKDFRSQQLYGTVSDTEGSFTLNLPVQYKLDTIQISFIGHESLAIPLTQFIGGMLVIELKPSSTYLRTLVIRNLTARELFEKCIDRVKENFFETSFINGCFYWQSQRDDDRYKGLEHAYVTTFENIGSKTEKRILRIDSAFRTGHPEDLHFLENMDNIFTFDFIRMGTDLLKEENLDEWRFTYNDRYNLPDNYTIIDAVRLDKVKKLKLLINDKDYAIEEVDYLYKWKKGIHHVLNDSLLYTMGNLQGKVIYKKESSHYNLKYIFNDFHYHVFEKLTYKKLFTRYVRNEIVTFYSRELRPGTESQINDKKPFSFPDDFVTVNKEAYCEAAENLQHEGP